MHPVACFVSLVSRLVVTQNSLGSMLVSRAMFSIIRDTPNHTPGTIFRSRQVTKIARLTSRLGSVAASSPCDPNSRFSSPESCPTILVRAPVATPRIRNRAPHGPHTPTTRPAPQITRLAAPPRATSHTGPRVFPRLPSAPASAPSSHDKRQALVASLEAAPKRSAPTLRACRADTSAPPSPNPPALLARTDFARDSSSISVSHQTPI